MTLPAYRSDDGVEEPLPRGDVTEAVVRVGQTVHRPAQPQSAAVADYLRHLRAVGFDGAPRFLGRDRSGRDVLDYLEGDVPGDPPEPWAADEDLLASVGVLLLRLHEASAGYAVDRAFAAPPGASWFTRPFPADVPTAQLPAEPAPELVSHNDVTPQNVVVRAGRAVGLVDFDMAGPTTHLIDVYNTAMHWVPLRDPVDVWPTWTGLDQPHRLRLLVDAYGLTADQRSALIDLGVHRADRT
ncbi:MAG: phosphotransferase [Actinomycetota bacterium]|nr:phosphotransferase [Actinomycetota bacterium]